MGYIKGIHAEMTASGGANPTYEIKPPLDHEVYEITNIFGKTDGAGSLVLSITDGTNSLNLETRTTIGAYANMPLFADSDTYFNLTNGDSAAASAFIQVVVHDKNSIGR